MCLQVAPGLLNEKQQYTGSNYLEFMHYPAVRFRDISPLLGELRVIKTPFEIEIMKQAGEIAQAMMLAAHNSLPIMVIRRRRSRV